MISKSERIPRKRRSERGEGNIGCIFWALVFAAVAGFGWKAIPIKMASSQLNDYMVEQAKFALRSSPQQIKTRIINKGQELGLPITRKDCQVSKTGARVRMICEYTVRVDFPLYEYDWDFDLEVDRAIYQWVTKSTSVRDRTSFP